jgi:Protein of unknown function (DUF3761)
VNRPLSALLLAFVLFSQFPVLQSLAAQAAKSVPAPHDANNSTTQAKPKCVDNGTYVNSQGETVKRPETCSSVPDGATAQCRDGSYSFSKSRRGTCSHRGGVSKWL